MRDMSKISCCCCDWSDLPKEIVFFLIFPVFSTLLQPLCALSKNGKQASRGLFHRIFRFTENFKKTILICIFIWQICWTQGFSTINFHFHGVISFEKLRISWQIYPLDFVSSAKLSLDSHFPNSKTPGKRKIIVSKRFFHTKFDKFI